MRRNPVIKVLRIVFFAAIAVSVVSFVVMSLWNVLMPAIFGLHAISVWQALGLLVLSKLLFGSLRPSFGARQHWRKRMAERFEKMTPEEREKFRRGMRCRPEAEAQAQA